jgi:CHAT domain-containing protein
VSSKKFERDETWCSDGRWLISADAVEAQDGEAHDLMVDFYKNWLTQAHSDPAKALRDTQLSWMKQDKRRDPRAWARYVLIE